MTRIAAEQSDFFEICADGHHCENGSKCVENQYDEGNYYCDCDEVVFNAAYEGLRCEHEATVYCTFNEAISKKSFCTNGGECEALVNAEEAHLGCVCPDNYEGAHCQYVKGTKPDGWPYNKGGVIMAKNGMPSNSSGGKGMHGGIIALIIIFCLTFVSVVGYFLYKQKMQSSHEITSTEDFHDSGASPNPPNITGQDLLLEADGSGLKETVQNQNQTSIDTPSTTTVQTLEISSKKNIVDDAEII